MCGRFTLRAPASVVAEQFAIFEVPPFGPRFNVAPTQPVAVVRVAAEAAEPRRELVWLRWGLIPSWAKDPSIGGRMINARAETVAGKPAYRAALRRRRCLVVADGFYEWQKSGSKRQPYFIHLRDDRPLAFAGLWESWEGADASAIESCTILTTEANELVAAIHDRMPVILPPDSYSQWLDPRIGDPKEVRPLLAPYPVEAMEAYAVTTYVNSPRHNDAGCIERAA